MKDELQMLVNIVNLERSLGRWSGPLRETDGALKWGN